MKYLVTDPCYTIDGNSEAGHKIWKDFLDECTYISHGTYTHIMCLATYPKQWGRHKILEIHNIPWGDISMGYKGQTFGADAGLVCICEVPNDYDLKESCEHYGVIIDTYEEAYGVMVKCLQYGAPAYDEEDDDEL